MARQLLGDAIGANLFMVGYAWQKGLLPLTLEGIERAIELNGVSVESNKSALLWGRRAAEYANLVEKMMHPVEPRTEPVDLKSIIVQRVALLTRYQDTQYARRYERLIRRVEAKQQKLNRCGLAETVARGYARILAYKDEYEVARLFSLPEFKQQLSSTFSGDYKLNFKIVLPLIARIDRASGRPRRHRAGPWMMPLFKLLSKLKALRQTRWDPFAHSADRRLERQLILDYESMLELLLAHLSADNFDDAVAIAQTADEIRGFGPVKRAAADRVRARQRQLMDRYLARQPLGRIAA